MIYTTVDESYNVFTYRSIKKLSDVLTGLYNDCGELLTEQSIRKVLNTKGVLRAYVWNEGTKSIENDWYLKAESHK